MGYRGSMFPQYRAWSKEVYVFLRKALMIPPRHFPARGPDVFQEDNLEYINNYTGDITSFTGREIIRKNGVKIYERNYIGAFIWGKYNIDMEVIY